MQNEQLHRKVLEDLWPSESGGFKLGGVELTVSASFGVEDGVERIEETDLERLFNSGIPNDLRDITFRYSACYSNLGPGVSINLTDLPEGPGIPFQSVMQRLRITIKQEGKVEIEVEGEGSWVSQVRGTLDPYLRQKIRKTAGKRAMLIISWTLFPLAATVGISIRLDSEWPFIIGFFYVFVAFNYTQALARKAFPKSLIVINYDSVSSPWYVERIRELWSGIVIGSLATLIIGLFGL